MRRGGPAGCAAAVWLAGAAVIVPVLAAAQVPFDAQDPRARFRDPRRTPDSSQRLDEQVRKLKSDEPAKRLEGLGGLGEMNDPKAVELLVAAASDPDKRVRVKAIDMLGQVRAKEATPLLTQRLFLRDTDLGTKQHILASLGKIGDPRATGPLLDFLERDVDPAIRGNAIYALGDIGDRAALARLEEFAASSEDENLRRLATAAVKKIRARPEPELVVPALAVDRRGEGPQAPR